ncbi:MAG TPA: AEC family transporter [Caldilineae bacterium]|nr:AEC family transporter [Caldilineae bacterium]
MSAAGFLPSLGQVLLQVLAPIALMVAAGFLLRKRLVVDVRSISRIVFYTLAPCLVYTSILTLDFDLDTAWRSLAFAGLHMATMGVLAFLLARRWRYGSGLGSAFILCAILLNNGNYGLPLNLFAFGPEGFGYALILFMFNSLVGSTISIYLLARGHDGGRLALQRTLATPIIWAMALGFLSRFSGVAPTGSLFDMIELAGRSAIPVFLIVLGMALAQVNFRTNLRSVSRLTTLRMLGGPAFAILLARLVGLTGVAYSAAIMQGSMPTAVNAIVLSNEFETTPDFVAGSVFATTIASIITLPALLLWLT